MEDVLEWRVAQPDDGVPEDRRGKARRDSELLCDDDFLNTGNPPEFPRAEDFLEARAVVVLCLF
jgi:hypothetical protein